MRIFKRDESLNKRIIEVMKPCTIIQKLLKNKECETYSRFIDFMVYVANSRYFVDIMVFAQLYLGKSRHSEKY